MFTAITDEIGHERVVVGRAAITDVELALHPQRYERELLIRRRYVKLVEQMDETERVPEWLALAKARQGSE